MGYLEMISIDENGVTVTPVSEISIGDEIETLMALEQKAYTLCCVDCFKPIPSGMGHSYCETHLPKKG